MPEIETVQSVSNFTPNKGEVVTFYSEENGKIVLKAKKSDGSISIIAGEKQDA